MQVFQTKRKAFNMAAARAPEVASDGTFGDAAPPRRIKASGRPVAKSQPKWKAQSNQLRAAMAAGRGVTLGGDAAQLGFAAPPEPDMVSQLLAHIVLH